MRLGPGDYTDKMQEKAERECRRRKWCGGARCAEGNDHNAGATSVGIASSTPSQVRAQGCGLVFVAALTQRLEARPGSRENDRGPAYMPTAVQRIVHIAAPAKVLRRGTRSCQRR